ncbi:MAG: membrane dipeptidase [Bacteroidia bacterium]
MSNISAPLFPVADLHCDLLAYLALVPGASLYSTDDIGATLPWLKKGNVQLQVTAIFTKTEQGSVSQAKKQALMFRQLTEGNDFCAVTGMQALSKLPFQDKTGILAAIENASGLCEESEPLQLAFERLEEIIQTTGQILYIGLTHHTENRFGGGNFSENVGLKSDGEALLEYISGRKICLDLAHTSDALAFDVINYISQKQLQIPVIASHSNFRAICPHVRNLPDELAQEVINGGGLIGINFFREYVDIQNPKKLFEHITYGLDSGAAGQLCLGADYFYIHDIPDLSRHPLFFESMANAGTYQAILNQLSEITESVPFTDNFASGNVRNFLQKLWSS